jgi:hypothetical protein
MKKRANETPAPGQYGLLPTTLESKGASVFNSSKSKSDLDWKIYEAKLKPGPGE